MTQQMHPSVQNWSIMCRGEVWQTYVRIFDYSPCHIKTNSSLASCGATVSATTAKQKVTGNLQGCGGRQRAFSGNAALATVPGGQATQCACVLGERGGVIEKITKSKDLFIDAVMD